MAFEVLNRLRWKGGLGQTEIIILHRGAEGSRKIIPGFMIKDMDRHYFYYGNKGNETTIPMHRIREIRLEGKVIWKRKKEPKDKY